MDETAVLAYLSGIIIVVLLGRLFIVPIKKILKLLLNSVLGGFLIFIINFIGGIWNFHIGLNIITAIFVGLLGIPGSIVLILLKLLMG